MLSRLEEKGFVVSRIKSGRISDKLAALLYEDSEEQLSGMGTRMMESVGADKAMELFGTQDAYMLGKQINAWNREYSSSDNVIAVVLEGRGENVQEEVKRLVGKTDPVKANKGTIRGDLGDDSILISNLERRTVRNLIHASDPVRVETEINLFEEHFF